VADLPTSVGAARTLWGRAGIEPGSREIPEETPVALVHDATTTAVMMATPADLEDLILGFSLTEGIIASPADARSIEIAGAPQGVEARMWLQAPQGAALAARRRTIAGPTGCGLCGVDSLAEASRPPRAVGRGFSMRAAEVHVALDALSAAQQLGARTRAVHAAGWWTPAGLHAAREDVGRHNALDKLIGALAREGVSADSGAVVLTSRVSVEMVQKAAAFGAQAVIAVSAPTALAVRTAEAAGITLVAVARGDSFEVFTRPERVLA
jgi:FdhD protein